MYKQLLGEKHLWSWVGVIAGALGTGWSLYLAFYVASPRWYTPFVLGSYVLLSSMNFVLSGKSTCDLLIGNPRKWLRIYGWLFVLGFVIDVVFGRIIGRLWHYPSFDLLENVVHVWLIGYPFALLSGAELYWLLSQPFGFSPGGVPQRGEACDLSKAAKAAVSLAIASILAVIFARLTADLETTRKFMFATLLLATVGFDSFAYLLKKPSFLQTLCCGNKNPLLLLAVCTPLVGAVHEIPNTFAHEWIYENIPLIGMKILGVNLVVLTLGWLFLLVVPLSLIHIIAPESAPKVPCGSE